MCQLARGIQGYFCRHPASRIFPQDQYLRFLLLYVCVPEKHAKVPIPGCRQQACSTFAEWWRQAPALACVVALHKWLVGRCFEPLPPERRCRNWQPSFSVLHPIRALFVIPRYLAGYPGSAVPLQNAASASFSVRQPQRDRARMLDGCKRRCFPIPISFVGLSPKKANLQCRRRYHQFQ